MEQTLAIAIPAYNNTLQLKECLHSIQLQSLKKFEIYVYDDASEEDYLSVINSFVNLSIHYKKNTRNFGAMANMQYAFNNLKERYDFVMIMHEDDLLHPQFIEMFFKAISVNKNISFAITNFTSFDNYQEFKKIAESKYKDHTTVLINKIELTLKFLQLNSIAFGSVVFNTSFFKNMNFNFEQYEEFADRPFLLNGLNDLSQIALINEPLYFYRSHGVTDTRWKKLRPIHVFNLLELYRKILLKSHFISTQIFKMYAMNFVIDSYKNLLLTGKDFSFLAYLFKAKANGLFDLKYALLKISIINKAGTCFKKIFH